MNNNKITSYNNFVTINKKGQEGEGEKDQEKGRKTGLKENRTTAGRRRKEGKETGQLLQEVMLLC